MSVIKITVDDQNLHITDSPKIAAQGVNENYVEFTFSADWDGFGKTAIFYVESDPETVYISLVDGNGLALIPHEITVSEGRVCLGLSGVKDDVVKTSEILTYKIVKGLYVAESAEPSPGIYEQMLSIVGGIQSDQEAFISETEESIAGIEANVADIEAETSASIEMIDGRVDNLVADVRGAEVTTLWTGSINRKNDTVTLSEDVSEFEFLDIYVLSSGVVRSIRVPAPQTSISIPIQSPNIADDASSIFLYIWETWLTISGTTATIDECIWWAWLHPGTGSPSVSSNATNGPTINRIDGVKTASNVNAELADIRVGADGTTYETAGAAVRAQIQAVGDELSTVKENLQEYEDIFTGDLDESISAWLDAHPEATTTVQDGSITYSKFSSNLFSLLFKENAVIVENINDLVLVSGKTYIFKNGTYTLSNAVTGTVDDVKIYGNGSVIKNTSGGKAFDITGDNIEICDMEIINDGSYYPQADVPRYGSINIVGDNFNVHDIKITKVNKAGISCTGFGEVHDCKINGQLTTGVYDAVSSDNQQYGIEILSSDLTGNVRVYNNEIKNIIQGVYYGDYNFVSGNEKHVEVFGNRFENCLDHCIYINGGYASDIYDNTAFFCGQICTYNLGQSNVHDNYLNGGFDNSSLSAVKTYAGINVRDPNIANIEGNCICGKQNQAAKAIYVQHLSNDVMTINMVSITNNVIDVEASNLICVGDTQVTINKLLIVGNNMKTTSVASSGEPIQLLNDVKNMVMSDNIIEFVSTRAIGIQVGTVDKFILDSNLFEDTYTGNPNVFYHTQMTNGKIRNNKSNGNLIIGASDDLLVIDGNTVNWVNTNNMDASADISVRNNVTTITSTPNHGTVTTNASGVASLTNLRITKASVLMIQPTSAVSGFYAYYTIGNNGNVTINSLPSISLSYVIL